MSIITLEEIEKAKAVYKEVFVVEVDMNEVSSLADQLQDEEVIKFDTSGEIAEGENIFRAILKKPEKRVLGLAMTGKDPIQMGNTILKNSIVEADPEITENDDVNVVAALQVIKFISLGQGKLKKF